MAYFKKRRQWQIRKLNEVISARERKFVVFLIPFAMLIALVEMIGISAVMPFIHIATDFGAIQKQAYYRKIYHLLGFESEVNFVLAFAGVLVVFYLFRAGLNQFYIYTMSSFAKRCARDVSLNLFRSYIGFSYRNFIERNSAKLVKAVLNEANNISNILVSYIKMFTEMVILVAIYIFLLVISWKITLLLTLFLAINAALIMKTVTRKIRNSGKMRERSQQKFFEILHRAFGNFKMVKLRSNEPELLEAFSEAGNEFMQANIRNDTLSQTPKIYLEAVGFIMLVLLVGYWVEVLHSDIRGKVAVLGVFILALYRMMPAVSRITFYYNQIVFLEKSLEIVHRDLSYDVEKIGDERITFHETIELRGVGFEYLKDKPIFTDVFLEIRKGEKVAFIGESGSGKSTLVDVLIGLYKPLTGGIYVDGVRIDERNIRAWRRNIGYIPQDIYLFEGSVAQNVAFEKVYDPKKVEAVLKQARIYDFLAQQHEGVNTQVGERGVKLSGGQKQRVAIARALYHDPKVLVLDEATSALDSQTELQIMNEIYALGSEKTLIIIAHRLSTISQCDTVYRIENGTVIRIENVCETL